MIIGFPCAFKNGISDEERKNAELFVRLVRKHHPTYELVQMADSDTPEIAGIDSCFRTKTEDNFGVWYFKAALNFPANQFLRLDYDTVILRDVSGVFNREFEIAIAREVDGVLNNGVMFVKNKRIFKEALNLYLTSKSQDGWMDLQRTMQRAINTLEYSVLRLDAWDYNHIYKEGENLTGVKILHFKGRRKKHMHRLYEHE